MSYRKPLWVGLGVLAALALGSASSTNRQVIQQILNGTGIINTNSSGTITVPNATDTLVGKATTDIFTNKTEAVGSNHITSTAARAAQFNAGTGDLEPSSVTTTELGYVSGATSSIQNQINTLTAASTSSQPYAVINVGLSAAISSNTLVISVKQSDGSSDCSGGNPCTISFRSSTATTGSFSAVNITAAASVTLGTTDSIGVAATAGAIVYVYYVSDGGSSEPCVSNTYFDEGTVASATAFTAGAETSATTLYCTNAHTSKPIRYIGRVTASWGNPNWSSITEVSLLPARKSKPPTQQRFTSGSSATYTTPAGVRWIRIKMVGAGAGGLGSGTANRTTNATAGGNSSWLLSASTILQANGGALSADQGTGGAGGSATINSPAFGTGSAGGNGTGGPVTPATGMNLVGGQGGGSCYGTGGGSGPSAAGIAGVSYGSGGGGGGNGGALANSAMGSGGGAGACIDAIIISPASSYTYNVGSHGVGANAGTSGNGGGNGADGYIEVTEFYE